jgi:hypothetical protein
MSYRRLFNDAASSQEVETVNELKEVAVQMQAGIMPVSGWTW